MERKAAQLVERVNRAMDAADEGKIPDVEGLLVDRTELENVAPGIRVTDALLLENLDRLVSEP